MWQSDILKSDKKTNNNIFSVDGCECRLWSADVSPHYLENIHFNAAFRATLLKRIIRAPVHKLFNRYREGEPLCSFSGAGRIWKGRPPTRRRHLPPSFSISSPQRCTITSAFLPLKTAVVQQNCQWWCCIARPTMPERLLLVPFQSRKHCLDIFVPWVCLDNKFISCSNSIRYYGRVLSFEGAHPHTQKV